MTDHSDPSAPGSIEPASGSPASGPPVPDRMASANGARNGKVVALTNWLVSRATGALEKRTSRRGFLVGSAMVGSAVAVSGCMVTTRAGTPYNFITDCAGGLCNDGYTEFCCVINDGINACPPDSFAGGWWRADFSSFCNGTRYYIDCMQHCCGPRTGYQNFCAGCSECRCAGDCNTRKVYCNYFRYGQCHQELAESGPIACRVVTCVPPWQNAEWACSTAAAVDNSTAQHHTPCLDTMPHLPVLPATVAAFEAPFGVVTFAARNSAGNLEARTFQNDSWLPPVTVIGGADSAPAAAVNSAGGFVFARGFGSGMYYNRLVNGAWQTSTAVGGIGVTSDPVALNVNDEIHVFARSAGNSVWRGRFVGSAFQGWQSLQGYATSNLTATTNGLGTFVFSRGFDGALWYRRIQGGDLGAWTSLGGELASDPSAVADGNSIWVFARFGGRQILYRRFDGGGWSPWQTLGGAVLGDPKVVMALFGPVVFARDDHGDIWRNAFAFGEWTTFRPTFGFPTTSANPAAFASTFGLLGFLVGRDGAMWWGPVNDNWMGWQLLGGSYSPVSGA